MDGAAAQLGVGAAVLSAASQASVHMIWKSAGDKLVVRAIIGAIGTVVMLPVIFFVQLPTATVWIWLIASMIVHLFYQLILIEAYRKLDFSVAYPLARGVAPIATALLGVGLLNDDLSAMAFLGIFVISAGLIVLASKARPNRSGLIAAILAGLLTTCYTLIDASGIREADEIITFVAWFFVLDGVGMFMIATIRRGRALPKLMLQEGKPALAGSVISLLGYASALTSFRWISAGAASALRETSVVFAAILGRLFLKEVLDRSRIAGVGLIVGGAAILTLNI
jgi:drug/metabolite transporter (DMT)-like permease